MKVNRKIAPAIKPITQVDLLDIEAKKLPNGINFYLLEGGDQEVISLEIVFPAGRWYENKPLQAFFTAALLTEGTKTKSSQQVSEWIDFHGAELSVSASYDVAELHLVCLSKHIAPMMELLADVLTNPVFDQNELEIKRNAVKQKLQVNQQKTDFVAQRTFHNLTFGLSHPYGYTSSIEKYDAVTTDDLHQFHQSQYLHAKPFVLVAGKCDAQQLQLIEDTLADLPTGHHEQKVIEALPAQFIHSYTPFEQANQTSLRIGRPNIMLDHPDFGKLQLASAILGGYFGSRLMSNLREEKGLTYGVYSHLGAFMNQGFWFVGTDVGKAQRDLALSEIKHEIDKLQQELVSAEELELVRNYMMGKFLSKVDGTFSQASLFKSLILHGQNAKNFHHRINQVLTATADDVQAMAQEYFPLDELVEVMVG